MSLPRYPAYKPSGVDWLGEVPEHWGILQSRRMFKARREAAKEGATMLTASQKYGMIPQAEFVEREGRRVVEVIQGKDNLIQVEPDDFVISMRSFQGGLEWCSFSGSTSFHYVPVTPIKHVVPRFFAHLLKSDRYISALRSTTNLIRDGQEIRYSNFVQVPLPIIPASEQLAIATFLDRETSKIDALIAEQRRLIELLQEKRQSVISHAVTKGLNPDAPMKDSGVEWLGAVPEHWATTALKRIVLVCGRIGFRGYTTEDLVAEGEGALVLGGTNLTSKGRLDLSKQTFISWRKYEESPEIKVSINDLVIGQRGTCGKVVMINRDIGPATINPSLVLLKRPTVDSEFLCYWLMGDLIQSIFESFLNATAIPMLSQQQIGNVLVIHPPLDEQHAVVSFVAAETAQLDTLTAEANCAIDLLQERRSALISAAVTGQIDVRGLVPEAEAA
jgi:type I restriction enzyme, S subunit